ncbi:IclR family transcriptional regulator [Arboricoccus pini]|uniref:IclR family transcriptional regulator n=1 Tax=Arboricoccus pini TaxID=1963835 RepID=UPI001A9C3CBD|nr:IclR family transcriptional regulator [Arboricoccus pini]
MHEGLKTMTPKDADGKRSPKERSGQVQSLVRGLSLLEAIAASPEKATLSELSRMLDLPPSTTHRLLTTLQQTRFARFDAMSGLWQVGVAAFTTGNGFARTRDLTMIARLRMRSAMEESGETVNLYVPDSGRAICLVQVESRQMVRAIGRPGGSVMLHCSGVGKALLACMPDEEVQAMVRHHGLPAATPHTLTSIDALLADLRVIRGRGWSIDDEEHALGMRCVAAAILDEHASPVGALSISGPTARIPVERLQILGRSIRDAARALTLDMGGISAVASRSSPRRVRS